PHSSEPKPWRQDRITAAVLLPRSACRYNAAPACPRPHRPDHRDWATAALQVSQRAPFGADLLIGSVDRRQLVGGQPDELGRHAARNQAVWMIFPHQAAIGLA